MHCMLSAEAAILLGFHSLGMVLLFFGHVVITLFALGAGQSDSDTHVSFPPSAHGSFLPW